MREWQVGGLSQLHRRNQPLLLRPVEDRKSHRTLRPTFSLTIGNRISADLSDHRVPFNSSYRVDHVTGFLSGPVDGASVCTMVDKQCDDLRLDLRIVYDRPKAALLPPMLRWNSGHRAVCRPPSPCLRPPPTMTGATAHWISPLGRRRGALSGHFGEQPKLETHGVMKGSILRGWLGSGLWP